MAYDSYKLLQSQHLTIKDKLMDEKKKQIEYLYNLAMDREDNCTINGRTFIESPRLFDRKIKTNYFQTINCETINESDRFNSGNLLVFDSDNWICTSSFVFHGLYCKGNFIRCNYILKWQESNGSIVERPCLIQSAAQYNSGEDGNKTLVLGSDQLMIVLPNDKNTVLLDTPKSFYIDRNKINPTPYKTTRNDTVPYSDWDEGCINLIVTQRETSDKDRPDLMLCDYITPTTPSQPPDESTDLLAYIIYSGTNVIRIGGSVKKFTGTLKDQNGNQINMTPIWTVDPNDGLDISIVGDELRISCTDDNLDQTEITITVRDERSGFATSVNMLISSVF